MTIKGKAYIAGVYEHPTRKADDKSLAQLHAEVAKGALEDAGLTRADVDGFFCAGDAPGLGPLSLVDYMGLKVRHMDTTETGGSSYVIHVAHAAEAIAAGKCSVALITLAGRPRAEGMATGTAPRNYGSAAPDVQFEYPWGPTVVNMYAMAAQRHMHEFGTTSAQLAWIKVAASHHAQHNPHALLREVVTVDDVLNSPMIADPLHRLDCCVITDGGGALVVVSPEVAKRLKRPRVRAARRRRGDQAPDGRQDRPHLYRRRPVGRHRLRGGRRHAGGHQVRVHLRQLHHHGADLLEDLGFCPRGGGGRFVEDGNLIAGHGRLPFNTDGGGLCNNHPANRGGMTKVIEAVRQLRGEAHPKVQVPNCGLALAHGTGGSLGTRHGSATVILERE